MNVPDLQLDNEPIHHADCCLSLSNRLLDLLIRTFSETGPSKTIEWQPQQRTVLSVGSGTGLLEALLIARAESIPSDSGDDGNGVGNPGSMIRLSVEGVEVQRPDSRPSANKYLPEPSFHTVSSASNHSPRLADEHVAGLMFVYPRQPALVASYVNSLRDKVNANEGDDTAETSAAMVVWLGPRADWPSFSTYFRDGQGKEAEVRVWAGDEAGLKDYEIMAAMRCLRAV